jgi:hypothetical protein
VGQAGLRAERKEMMLWIILERDPVAVTPYSCLNDIAQTITYNIVVFPLNLFCFNVLYCD